MIDFKLQNATNYRGLALVVKFSIPLFSEILSHILNYLHLHYKIYNKKKNPTYEISTNVKK